MSMGHDLDLLRSCDIIGHVTIRVAVCGFLHGHTFTHRLTDRNITRVIL